MGFGLQPKPQVGTRSS